MISGNVAVGDLVTFVELGGIRTKGEIAKNKPGKIHIKSGEENDPVPVVFNGIENMKTEEEVLLFGRLNDRKVLLSHNFYTCVRGFQGKFQVRGNKAKRLTEHLDAVDRNTFSTLEMELTQLEAKVRSVKK